MTLIAQNACDLPMKDERRARSASVTGEESLAKLRMSHRDGSRAILVEKSLTERVKEKEKRRQAASQKQGGSRASTLALGARAAREGRSFLALRILSRGSRGCENANRVALSSRFRENRCAPAARRIREVMSARPEAASGGIIYSARAGFTRTDA